MTTGTAEERLLVTCLKNTGHIRGPGTAGLESVDDWAAAGRSLGLHGLAPLAGVVFSSGAPPNVAPELLEEWKFARHRSVILHQVALKTLGEIAPGILRAGVPCAVLKGPHLYAAYYSGRFPRPYGDIDLLVRRCDVARALEWLREAGYQPAGSRLNQFLVRRGHFHLVLHPADRGFLTIELHWSLVDRANLYRMDNDAVLSRAVEWSTEQARFGILSGEDTFIYLCLHAAKHGLFNAVGLRQGQPAPWFCQPRAGNRLLWYVDLDLLLRKEMNRLDWAAVRHRAAEWNVQADVEDTVRVLHRLLPDSPAAAAMERLGAEAARPPAPGGWLEKFVRPGEGGGLMRMSSRFFFRPARLLFIGRLFFPAARELRAYHRNSRWPLFLLYLFHPFHMIRKLLG